MRNSTLAIAAVLVLVGAAPAAATTPRAHDRSAPLGVSHAGPGVPRLMHPRMERPKHPRAVQA